MERCGDRPNVYWRAIPEHDLRFHPEYEALPPPEAVNARDSADLRLFRQSSWQWLEARRCRLTTSWAASALGLFEQKAARILRLPRHLQSHNRAVKAYEYLTAQRKRTFREMLNAVNAEYDPDVAETEELFEPMLWAEERTSTVWPYVYTPSAKTRDDLHGKAEARRVETVMEGRLVWGSIHETIGTLAAINFFRDRGGTVCETGLLALEASTRRYELKRMYPRAKGYIDSLGLLGASPDGIVRFHNSDKVAVLEVKSHSPFVRNRGNRQGTFIAGTQSLPKSQISAPYLIQLHMHMLCQGPNCRDAFLFQTSVGGGCNVFHVERNENLVEGMLCSLGKFYTYFVNVGRCPGINFSLCYGSRYLDFLKLLRATASAVQVFDYVPDEKLQRSPALTSLFLDRMEESRY